MLIGALWALFFGIEFIVPTFSQKMLFDTLKYIPAPFGPAIWLKMVIAVTGREESISRRFLTVILIFPILTSAFAWFDPMFHLVRTNLELLEGKYFPVLHKDYGPWYWVHYTYCCLVNGISIFILVDTVIKAENFIRKQAFIFLIGLGMIVSSHLIYIFKLLPFKDIDITPFVFIISSIVVLKGIVGYGLFNIIPVSRNFIFKKIDIGVIVGDSSLRVIDINECAVKILDIDDKHVIGRNIKLIAEGLIPDYDLTAKNDTVEKKVTDSYYSPHSYKQLKYQKEGREMVLDIKTEKLYQRRSKQFYWIIMLEDITEVQQVKKKIDRQNRELAVYEEQQRLARELHDNLGQKISFSKVQLQAIAREIQMDDYKLALEHIERLKEVLGQTHMLIREYVYDFRSGSLSDSSFRELISILIEENFIDAPVNFRVEISPDTESLFESAEKKLHIVSITKEAVNNSLKYSGASEIHIGTRKKDGRIYYFIRDNGTGISADILNYDKMQTYGLKIMRERAILTGGEMQISSSEADGTLIQICYYRN